MESEGNLSSCLTLKYFVSPKYFSVFVYGSRQNTPFARLTRVWLVINGIHCWSKCGHFLKNWEHLRLTEMCSTQYGETCCLQSQTEYYQSQHLWEESGWHQKWRWNNFVEHWLYFLDLVQNNLKNMFVLGVDSTCVSLHSILFPLPSFHL